HDTTLSLSRPHTHTQPQTHTHIDTRTHTHIDTQTHTYTDTHTHTHTHTHTASIGGIRHHYRSLLSARVSSLLSSSLPTPDPCTHTNTLLSNPLSSPSPTPDPCTHLLSS